MDIITEARRQVFLTGRLDFPDRQKLWRALGEAKYDEEGYAVRTKGLIRRVKLAKTCVKRILPIWDIYRKGDRRPFYILKLVDAYFRDEITRERLEQSLHNGMIQELDNFVNNSVWGNYYYNSGSVELLATRVIQMALYDDKNLKRNGKDENIKKREEKDISYFVYNIYYNCIQYNKKNKIAKIEEEQKYWLWYINEVADLLEEIEFEYSIF